MRFALGLAVVLLPSLAVARPITAGVHLGVDQSKESGTAGEDPNHTLGLFGRLGLTPRLSGQLEVQRIKLANDSTEVRSVTGLLVVDLSSSKTWVPVLLVGFGADKSSSQNAYIDCIDCGGYNTSESATHIEGGFGLEYRAPGGLTIGADVRMGGRSMPDEKAVPLAGTMQGPPSTTALYYNSGLQEGEYRSARITAGIRF